MTSPAQRHKQACIAQQAVVEESAEQTSAYELLLDMLAQHKRALKAQKSIINKNTLKAELLEEWHSYIDELTSNGNGAPNAIAGQLMVWVNDVGDYERFLALARYMLAHGISMPEHYERDLENVIAEDTAAAWLSTDTPTVTLEHLLAVYDLISDSDLFDEVRAKLLRAIGEAYAAADDTEQAISHLEQAISFNPSVGCKPLLSKLQKLSAARTEPEDTPKS